MNCWTVLDLPADADARTIRRRYAQLLKIHRPDEDPQAFQDLREAYERALQVARSRIERAEREAPAWPSADSVSTEPVSDAFATSLEPAQSLPQAAENGFQASQTLALQPVAPATAEAVALEQPPQHWYAEAHPPALDSALAQAVASGQREVFERGLLYACLSPRADAPRLASWALQRLHWFELGQRAELPLDAMDALVARLCAHAIGQLADHLDAGQERLFFESLQQLLDVGWLQGFDRRTQFQQALAQLLLDTPGWSDGLFGAICEACGWSESHFAAPWQWQALVQRAEQVAFERRLRGFLDSSRPTDAEQKAAWLLLKPMPADARERFKRSLTDEDWAAYGLLCDKLRYRYPALWDAWDCGEPEQPADPAPSHDGWRFSNGALYLLLLVGILISGAKHGVFDDSLEMLVPVAVIAAMGTAFLGWVMRGWGALSASLLPLDVRLSSWILPDSWVDGRRGLLLIRHLLPCAGLGLLLALLAGAPAEKPTVFGLFIFIGCGYYTLHAVRGHSLPEIALAWLLQAMQGTFGKVLLVVLTVAAFVVWPIFQADRARVKGLFEETPVSLAVPVPAPAPEPACADGPCDKWFTLKQSMLKLARAKQAVEQNAREQKADAAP